MHIITRDRIVYSFSRDHRPVQEVNSGDRIRFETYDARTGTILSETDLLDQPKHTQHLSLIHISEPTRPY